MKKLRNNTILFLIFTIVVGCSQKQKKPTTLRLGQFLISEKPVSFHFYLNGKTVLEKELGYASLTDYLKLPAGKYRVEVTYDNNLILKKNLGFGTGGKYTLFVNGIPTPKSEVNQTTLNARLHKITQGEEANSPNGNLPQLAVLNDGFECAADEAKIRWVHLAAGTESITGESISKKDTVKLSSLSYPKISKSVAITPENDSISWFLKGKKIKAISTSLKTEPEHLYTIFVIGKVGAYINTLSTVTGITEKQNN